MTTSIRFRGLLAPLCLLSLAACSTLPEIPPGTTPATSPTQVEGSRGPLSPARSEAILTELERGADDTSIFDRHLAVEQAVSDSPLLTGNRVRLLQDGPDTYRAMFAAIMAARDHINMETYILEDDEVGRRFMDALIEKQQQGVQVQPDPRQRGHAWHARRLLPAAARQWHPHAGVQPGQPGDGEAKAGWDVNERDHRKLLIVDGQTAFLGGINISSVYSGGSFRRQSKHSTGR